MERKLVSIAAKKRDSTIYIVEYTISDNAKESAYEKVKRLILKHKKLSGKIRIKACYICSSER